MLPPLDSKLKMAPRLPSPITQLSPTEQTLCKLVLQHGHLLAVLDHFEGSDYEACIDLCSLMQRDFLVVS